MSQVWLWVWEVASCSGGDIAAIVAAAQAHNVGLIVKSHDGATSAPNGYLGFRLIEECQKAGVPVRAWGYCYPAVNADLQADFAAQAGVDYIADVEVEYDGQRAAAAALVDALRAKLPGRRLGYAPLPIVSYHDGSGQYEEFNRLDVACPQAYAGTGGRDAIGALAWAAEEWSRAFGRCNVEPAVYAADQPADELRKAIAYVSGTARSFGNGDVSIWSFQHLTPEHWGVIDEFTKEADMDQPTFDKMALDWWSRPAAAGGAEGPQSFEAVKAVLAQQQVKIHVLDAADAAVPDALVGRVIQRLGQVLFLRPPDKPAGVPAGAAFFSESDDFSMVGWTYPDGVVHFFQNGVALAPAPSS